MAGIVDAMSSILGQLATLQVINGDQSTVIPYIRVWNNQLHMMERGLIEAIPAPAIFLEVTNPNTYESIGQGVHGSDLTAKIHIIHEYYNASDGTYAQDLSVFALRDSVVALLNLWAATGCGPFDFYSEHQDYSHPQLYHLELEFKCHFIDYKGSKLDPIANYYKFTTPPTAAEIQVTKDVGGAAPIRHFIIPTK